MGNLVFRDLDLCAPSSQPFLSAVAAKNGVSIRQAASFVERLFLLRSDWSPGLCFVGGQARPAQMDQRYGDLPAFSLAGAGEEPEIAFAACVGEAVERLSQLEQRSDIHCSSPLSDIRDRLLPGLASLLSDARTQIGFEEHAAYDWVEGSNLTNAASVLIPADWCLRRAKSESKLKPRSALSTGAAAGPTLEAATERALLELVERDAVSLWWRGGRRGRPLPLELAAAQKGMELVQALRQDKLDRASWLLDLTTDIGIPSVAAVSFDRHGQGLACGFAARVNLDEAVRAAIIEMMQMELGLQLAQTKQERMGESALSEVDRLHLRRSTAIDSETCDLVHPAGKPTMVIEPERGSPIAVLKAAFARSSIDVAIVNLTRDQFGIPVVFAFAPELQPMPSSTTTPRLRSMFSAAEFNERKMPDVALF
jgi:ribosomal protein S12 methylthiotransferase accessory factor